MNPTEEIDRWILLAHMMLAAGAVILLGFAIYTVRRAWRSWRSEPKWKFTPPIPHDQIEVRMITPSAYIVFDARQEMELDSAETMAVAMDKARHHRRAYYKRARLERDATLSGDLPALERLRAVLFGPRPDNG